MLNEQVLKLFERAGISSTITNIVPIYGGGNNRVHKVCCVSRSYLLKTYFYHPDDLRDRLHNEFSFARFVKNQGVNAIATPIAVSPETHQALYSFINGRKLTLKELTRERVDECVRFFLKINKNRMQQAAQALPNASEAYFSVDNHLEGVKNRIKKLQSISEGSEIDKKASLFIKTELEPAAKQCFDQIHNSKLDGKRVLIPTERCLSPSDFGFHNALLDTDNNMLRFIDFEYAGWDDPAKMIGDFFSQPALPVPLKFGADFAEKILQIGFDPQIRMRIQYFLPLYRIKWCCIILNEFVKTDAKRRAHAYGDSESRKRRQLELAEKHLSELQTLSCLHI